MPNYKSHLVGGVLVYSVMLCAVLYYYSPSLLAMVEWLLFALAGALFPDVDTKSKGQRWFYRILLILLVYTVYTKRFTMVAFLGMLGLLPQLVPHRGLFHRLWFIVALVVMISWISCFVMPSCRTLITLDALFFLLGAISHLWLDLGLRRMVRL